MNKKSFSAGQWFAGTKISPDDHPDLIRDRSVKKSILEKSILPSFCGQEQDFNLQTELGRFFVPGWKGESLISKDVKSFVAIIDRFHLDVKKHFKKVEKFSKRQKLAIFEEFLSFAEYRVLQCNELDNYTQFWKTLNDTKAKHFQETELFINIFSFRIAIIYLFKVRFISILQEQTQAEFDIKNIYYPNSFLTSVFKSASSKELKAKSFEQNIFSWYRPSKELEKPLLEFKNISSKLNITEIIKTVSVQAEQILSQKTYYSHSLSHKQFGLYLNSLLINFPIWLGTLNNQSYCPYVTPKDDMEIISCKYSGDYLDSLGLSHWLAQSHNKYLKWDQILCPDFKNNDFQSGQFLKNLSELQFLTFLAEIANTQGRDPIAFICSIANSHLYNRKSSNEIQKSLLLNDAAFNYSTYDRVIVNLLDFPKNNPQHYLYNKIKEQKKFLKESGLIYVLTSKKLFIPSQKQKVEGLLSELKIEGVFDLSAVEGKGEVGGYIYIFSHMSGREITDRNKKQTCLNFRYHSKLSSFHEFEKLTSLTQKFFEKNLGELPSLSQLYEGTSRMEFYQDAVSEGQLIHSTNKDASNITHPSFFRKLMALCNPFDYFFNTQKIDFNGEDISAKDTLFDYANGFNQEVSPHIVIVDQRRRNEVKIEFIPSGQLEAKAYEYGHASCHYFYVLKKWPSLNLAAVKDFLESSVGKQIINLTFSNDLRNVKGNLQKLLIPKFYLNDQTLPDHIKDGLKLLDMTSDDLLNMHPANLEKTFSDIECFIPNIINVYPAQILNSFAKFKRTLQQSIQKLGVNEDSQIVNFNNPLLKSPLLLSKTTALYPHNEEIYVDFTGEANDYIHSPLSRKKLIQQVQNNETSYGLELYAEESKVLTLYSDEDLIQFIDYLLSNTQGVIIAQLLQGISVPSLADLKPILSSYKNLKKSLIDIEDKLPPLQNRLLNSTIFNEK